MLDLDLILELPVDPVRSVPADGDALRFALAVAELAIDQADSGVRAPRTLNLLRRQLRRLRESLR